MAGNIQIVIKDWIIKAQALKLDTISKEVSARKITGPLSGSRGKTAESINGLISELNNLGTQLGALLNENAATVQQVAVQFTAADKRIASAFKSNG